MCAYVYLQSVRVSFSSFRVCLSVEVNVSRSRSPSHSHIPKQATYGLGGFIMLGISSVLTVQSDGLLTVFTILGGLSVAALFYVSCLLALSFGLFSEPGILS